MKKIGAAFLILISLSAGPSFAAGTSLFFNGGVISLEQPKIEIRKIHGLKFIPLNPTVKSAEKDTYIPHSIENLSNTTNQVSLEVTFVSKEKGWSVQLIKDDAGDGAHKSWESSEVEKVVEVGEGSVYHFFVKLTRPDDAQINDTGSAVIKADGFIKDGDSYIGYNGLKYGGPNEAESTDTVIIIK